MLRHSLKEGKTFYPSLGFAWAEANDQKGKPMRAIELQYFLQGEQGERFAILLEEMDRKQVELLALLPLGVETAESFEIDPANHAPIDLLLHELSALRITLISLLFRTGRDLQIAARIELGFATIREIASEALELPDGQPSTD